MDLVLPKKKAAVGIDLRRILGNDKVKDDAPTLRAYAVDASIYRITPQVVVFPKSERDIEQVLGFAVERSIPLTTRAAGTNLTG